MLHKNITQRSFHQSHHFAQHFLQNTGFCHLGTRYIDENTEVRKNKCHHCEQHISPLTGKPCCRGRKASEKQYEKHIYIQLYAFAVTDTYSRYQVIFPRAQNTSYVLI